MSLVDVAKLLMATTTLCAFGHGVTRLVAPKAPLARFERVAIAYLLGTGTASMLWTILMPLYAVVSPVATIAAVAWTVFGISLIKTRAPSEPQSDAARGWWTNVLTLLLVAELAALTAASWRSGLGFDGVFNFEMRARIAFESSTHGQIPLAFFSDESRAWSHLRYPLLVPFAEYWVYGWLARADQSVAKIVFPMFYMALVCVTAGAVRRLAGNVMALAAVTAMGTLPVLTVIPGAISGYAEVPLAAVFAAAVGCALIAVNTGDAGTLRLCGALLAVAAWTKAEGAILALCLAMVVLTVAGRKALPVLVLPVAVISAWAAFQQFYGLPERDFPAFTAHVVLANLERVPTIVRVAAREVLAPGHWGFLWPAFAVMCGLAIRRRSWQGTDVIAVAVVVIPLCIYLATYLFSGWTDVEAHVKTSFARLLVPLAPTAMLFTFVQLSESRFAAVRR